MELPSGTKYVPPESDKDLPSAIIRAHDGLENVVTGLGTQHDKSTSNRWVHSGKNLDHVQLSARYREDWISQKVCNIIPQDMTRRWRKISTPEGQMADKELFVKDKFREAGKWARLYGTSFMVPNLKGSGKLDTPLNIDNLKPGCLKDIQIVDRVRMYPVGIINYINPMVEGYGEPEFYQIANSSQYIHRSRLIRFEGTELPLYEQWSNQWYSDSTLIPLLETMDNYHVAANSAASMCQEALTDVVSIEGLQDLLSDQEGEQAILRRFRVMKQLKSIHNVILLDSTEDYDTKTINLNSIKELIWEYLRVVAASVGIPATRFLSASPDGKLMPSINLSNSVKLS